MSNSQPRFPESPPSPDLPASFQQRLQTPAVRTDFDTIAALGDYCASLLQLPLDGEPMTRYYLNDTYEFRISDSPFPTLLELAIEPEPGELYYSPTPGQQLSLQITGPKRHPNPPRPAEYPACRYYHDPDAPGDDDIRAINNPVLAGQLLDEYVPVPARSQQPTLKATIPARTPTSTD